MNNQIDLFECQNDDIEDILKLFSKREIKAKNAFSIKKIDKTIAFEFIKKYHYLNDAKFFSIFCFGLFCREKMVGCATFSNPQGIVALKGWFGFDNSNQSVLELSRLCVLPELNKTNATSYLLGNSLKTLKKEGIKSVITLADASRHVGSIYQVCNFKYYGLTEKKTDFFAEDGRINPRGSTKDVFGVWMERSRKHRYAISLDGKTFPLYVEKKYPTQKDLFVVECCNESLIVEDLRHTRVYSCPRCCGKLELLCQ